MDEVVIIEDSVDEPVHELVNEPNPPSFNDQLLQNWEEVNNGGGRVKTNITWAFYKKMNGLLRIRIKKQ